MLVLISAGIVGLLGLAHLILTFNGPKLQPRDPKVRPLMESVHPGITRQTTMWRAWLGFNSSHSLGALLFAAVYGYLAVVQSTLMFDSIYLQALGVVVLTAYLVLAKLYWFKTPLIGIGLSLLLFLGAIASQVS